MYVQKKKNQYKLLLMVQHPITNTVSCVTHIVHSTMILRLTHFCWDKVIFVKTIFNFICRIIFFVSNNISETSLNALMFSLKCPFYNLIVWILMSLLLSWNYCPWEWDIGPSGVRALPLAAGINVGGHYKWHFFSLSSSSLSPAHW